MDHQVRRRALGARLDGFGVDAMLITRQVNVRYLSGSTGTNGQVLLMTDAGVFLTDGRYEERTRHEVPDMDRRIYSREYRSEVAAFVAEHGVERLGFEASGLTVAAHLRLEAALEGVRLVPVHDAVEDLRRVKDADEWELLRSAQRVTDAAFEAVLDLCSVGVSERHLALELERLLRSEGADDSAFDPIVAFGENAAEPHHDPGHRLLEEGDVITLDFGGRVGGYHADMTRTVSFGAAPTELRKIHDIVREAQQAGIDAVRAGVSGAAVDAASRTVIDRAGYEGRFVHGLGHGVGLEIHEAPWLAAGQDGELAVGEVVTVEPGIYIPGLGGVRVEDTVEVTQDGCRPLPTSTRESIEL